MMKLQKSMLSILIFTLSILPLHPTALAQDQSRREIIQRAMKDEMTRNIEKLALENLERPFYISYSIQDVMILSVSANLGSIVFSDINHHRNHSVRLMVGDYHCSDENFLDFGGSSYRSTLLNNADQLPLEDDYQGIRRALWIATDNVYKSASEKFERKKAALEQQNLSEEVRDLDDFTRVSAVKFSDGSRKIPLDQQHWEDMAGELSGIFKQYPDIYTSQVRVFLYFADVYMTNTEGTETVHPLSVTAVQINASTQAVDGDPLTHQVLFHGQTPKDLPLLGSMKESTMTMADELIALRTAPVFMDAYTGPVMLEDQAVAEFFIQRLFTGSNGLLAHRKPVVGDARTASFIHRSMGKSLEEKLNRRILSRDLTIKALPTLDNYSGIKLLGNYQIDAEGIRPPDEIVLVENGMLKAMLCNRTPTPKIKTPSGHQRPIIGTGQLASSGLGPGVIAVTTSRGKSEKQMKKTLLKLAREEGLDYAILIRKLKSQVAGFNPRMDPMSWLTMTGSSREANSLTDPILVYRVSVKDGREELLRSVKLGNFTLSAMRHILGSSKQQFVYNTLAPSVGGEDVYYAFARNVTTQGVPASFIVPRSIIFEELDVENAERDFTPKMPVVESPLVKR